MKALSLWQPHALAICLGLKKYETRHWPFHLRERFAIHASRRQWTDRDPWSLEAARRLRSRLFPSIDDVEHTISLYLLHLYLTYGAIVCTANLVDCIPTSQLRGRIPPEVEFWGDFTDGENGKGRYAFVLEDVKVFPHPIPCIGRQGPFNVSLDDQDLISSKLPPVLTNPNLPLFPES